MRETVQIAA